jgi:hypothetical protein
MKSQPNQSLGTDRLRPDDKRAILHAARKAGKPYAVWMRQVLLRAARRAGATASR